MRTGAAFKLETLALTVPLWMASVVGPTVALAGPSPEGVAERQVTCPTEISGVAKTRDGFLVVGDDTPEFYFAYSESDSSLCVKGRSVEIVDRGGVNDAESIDVGYGPNGEEILFFLSEKRRKVYIGKKHHIELPEEFAESPGGRGAEGLSVRWRDNGWDLIVVWEGGVDCKSSPNKPWNAKVARYRLSPEGKNLTSDPTIIELQTKDLLKTIEPEESFRATDIAWYGTNFLVLLGSMPNSCRFDNDPFRRTWIQEFDDQGKPIDGRRMRLEEAWGSYRRGKNWEALDTTLDGKKLLLGYDGKGASEIVRFVPVFK